jgi:murein DD-endopeptidase MepM/ murein hydrolase activator NlpD
MPISIPVIKSVCSMMNKIALLLLLTALLLTTANPVGAQTGAPNSGPIYIVQPGDSLLAIAVRFNVTLDDLLAANNISNPNLISPGMQLVIPGLEDVEGVLITEIVAYGDSYRSLVRRNQISETLIQRLNRLVSPTELYAGVSLVVVQPETSLALASRAGLGIGETLLELAVREDANPWTVSQALPGDVLYLPGEPTGEQAVGLPAVFTSAHIRTLPLKQGSTAQLNVTAPGAVFVGGLLVDQPLRFFPLEDDEWVALQGVHAMLEPGIYPLRIEAELADGSRQSFEQMVLVVSGNYPNDPLLVIQDATTIDLTVSETESAQIIALVEPASQIKHWQGRFQNPAALFPNPQCFTSRFGNRRTYQAQDGSTSFSSFHSGLDYCGGTGLQISAPAGGQVVFADLLTVRGYATLIDHGWGIYTGYWHQSEIMVQVGELVEPGQVIGAVGATGRVTGAHLHWEIWVNGIQVDPEDWLAQTYP